MIRRQAFSFIKKHRLFRDFLASNTISLMGNHVFDIAVPLFVLERTQSVLALSAVAVAIHLPFFIMAPFTGFSADYFNKRRLMLVTDIGQILCMLAVLAYDLSGTDALWPVLITVFIAKTLMQTSETVITFQLIPSLVPAKDLPEANTWFLSSQRFIHVGGPVTAGLLLSSFGIRACILFNIVSFGYNLFLVYRTKNLNDLVEKNLGVRHESSISLKLITHSFSESTRYVWTSPLFRPFIMFMFLWNLSSFLPNTPSTTFYFTKSAGFSAADYGMIVSMLGGFSLLGFLISGSLFRRFNFTNAFVGGAFFQAFFAMTGIFFVNHPATLAILFALSRSASSLVSMGAFLIRQTQVPRHRIGGVNACLRMFFMSAAPISSALQGVIISNFGVEVSLATGVLALWGCYYYCRQTARAMPKASVEKVEKSDEFQEAA